ncbi:hypothetical protein V5799_031936 [Amblyomma americanum]|uniref:Uncharacterized protein n=1 Tax=Amblyomma americanum TaxID=6943 RepID=A0AAQ4DSL4_AMBAM
MWTVRLESGQRDVNFASVAVDDNIYTFGGHCTGEDCINRNPIDVHALDAVSLRWILLQTESNPGDVPFKSYGHTAVVCGGCVYLWGGRDNGPCNTLYCFDTYAKVWTRPKVCSEVPWPRDGNSACVIGKRMFVLVASKQTVSPKTCSALDLESFQWQQLRTMGESPLWRCFHSASAIGDRMYVWEGRSDAQGPLHTHDEV